MRCQACHETAVISTSNGTFCRRHFIGAFERTTLDTIETYGLVKPTETIAIANSGGKDSLSLLHVVAKYFKGSNKLVSITIDEGISGYRDKTIDTMKKYCSKYGVEYRIYSYKDFTGETMDVITHLKPGVPCATCGVLRRYLLNAAAIDCGADKIATAHNMDDEAENVLMNLLQNDFEKLLRLGPISGITSRKGFVPRVKPFMFLSEKETMLFSILNGINAEHKPCPYAGFGFRGVVSRKLKELESVSTGAKRSIIDKMLQVRASHGSGTGEPHRELFYCDICGAPTSEEVCEACNIKAQIKRLKRP